MVTLAQLRKERITIVGLGLTGLSCARYLHERGIPFSAMDSRENPPGLAGLKALCPELTVHLGALDVGVLQASDRLLLSPGVDPRVPAIQAAIETGVALSGDVDLFAAQAEAPLIAVTGSNAKSTVVSMLGDMASASGLRAVVAGNIGTPVLDLLSQPAPDVYVLELSSFQLETTAALKAKVASILNLSEDHMDRYASMDEYLAAKQKIFVGADTAVINRDDPATAVPAECIVPRVLSFGMGPAEGEDYGLHEQGGSSWLAQGKQAVMAASSLKVSGRHNLSNALAALTIGHAAGWPLQSMISGLQAFPGLPHRCQWVAEYDGVNYYNDSKGTNVGATVAAIEGLAEGGLVLIAGGLGKGADFSPLQQAVQRSVRAVILLGEDAPLIAQCLKGMAPLYLVDSMEEAVIKAASLATPGQRVLLSPACASMDMFRDYQHRGDCFVAAVKRLGQLKEVQA